MTFLVERLAELRKHLVHLKELAPRVRRAEDLERDLSLHNDVLFSLLSVCQLVIDIAGEISAAEGLAFGDYTEAVRNLRRLEGFDRALVDRLERLPGFRNVVIHEYVGLDLGRAVDAVHGLEPIERFVGVVAERERRVE